MAWQSLKSNQFSWEFPDCEEADKNAGAIAIEANRLAVGAVDSVVLILH